MEAIKDVIPNAFDDFNINKEFLNSSENNNSNINYIKEMENKTKNQNKNNIVKSDNIIYVIIIHNFYKYLIG